eukprot:SAG31_NODE_191_length_20809_cov_64.613761_6_plen_161_part_00
MLRSHLHSNSPKNRNIDDEYKQWQSKLAVAEAAGAGDLAEYKRLRPAAVPDHDAANPIISRTRPPWSRSTPRGQWTQLVSADPARPEVRRYEEFEKKISLKIEKAFKGGRTPLVRLCIVMLSSLCNPTCCSPSSWWLFFPFASNGWPAAPTRVVFMLEFF